MGGFMGVLIDAILLFEGHPIKHQGIIDCPFNTNFVLGDLPSREAWADYFDIVPDSMWVMTVLPQLQTWLGPFADLATAFDHHFVEEVE